MKLIKKYEDVEIDKIEDKDKNHILSITKSHHSGNLTVVGFVIFWTFIANIGYLFAEILVSVSYVAGFFLLMIHWFCECRVVRPCPKPYNRCCDCCCCGCCDNPFFGMVSGRELCKCLIPPNDPKIKTKQLRSQVTGRAYARHGL